MIDDEANAVRQQALHGLLEADALLAQGMHRVLQVSGELPGACEPLQEVLRLSEQQSLRTLEAVEAAQSELQLLRDHDGGFSDPRLQRVAEHLQAMLVAQQSQDLAGQRLRRTIALLMAAEARIRDALGQFGVTPASASPSDGLSPLEAPGALDTFGAGRLAQDDIDGLLARAGI